jgi:hypothetical protein
MLSQQSLRLACLPVQSYCTVSGAQNGLYLFGWISFKLYQSYELWNMIERHQACIKQLRPIFVLLKRCLFGSPNYCGTVFFIDIIHCDYDTPIISLRLPFEIFTQYLVPDSVKCLVDIVILYNISAGISIN